MNKHILIFILNSYEHTDIWLITYITINVLCVYQQKPIYTSQKSQFIVLRLMYKYKDWKRSYPCSNYVAFKHDAVNKRHPYNSDGQKVRQSNHENLLDMAQGVGSEKENNALESVDLYSSHVNQLVSRYTKYKTNLFLRVNTDFHLVFR